MYTRTQIFTLLGISVGLASLVGCDDPDQMHDLDATTKAQLSSLGARQAPAEYLEQHDSGTLLWLSNASAGLPELLRGRGPGARVMYFPGEGAQLGPSWSAADWVVPGPWPEAIKQLHSDLWKPALA